jgi:hypothetical protein
MFEKRNERMNYSVIMFEYEATPTTALHIFSELQVRKEVDSPTAQAVSRQPGFVSRSGLVAFVVEMWH